MNIHMVAKSVAALFAALCVGTAVAAPLAPPLAGTSTFAALALGSSAERIEPDAVVRTRLRRQVVSYQTQAGVGTVVIDTAQTFLYYVLGDGTAIRYGIGVGRDGFAWAGA